MQEKEERMCFPSFVKVVDVRVGHCVVGSLFSIEEFRVALRSVRRVTTSHASRSDDALHSRSKNDYLSLRRCCVSSRKKQQVDGASRSVGDEG